MAKRYRAPMAPAPLRGQSGGAAAGRATHTVRVMHRECVHPSTQNRRLLREHAYAVVEYRGSRSVRVVGAGDDEWRLTKVATDHAANLSLRVEHTNVRPLSRCKAVTKNAASLSRQELHVADIRRIRKCRVCGSKDGAALCKPLGVATQQERKEAMAQLQRLQAASQEF